MTTSSRDSIDNKIKALGIGRFQVMALLQCARYYVLNRDIDRAKSFGLNRAVFYAWAKHYGSDRRRRFIDIEEEIRRSIVKGVKPIKCPEGYVEELGECVKKSERGFYTMNDVEQTPYDYNQQIVNKINRLINYDKIWSIALDYLSKFPEWVLKDPVKFYKYVYEPVRDVFFQRILVEGRIDPSKNIVERIESMEEMMEKTRSKQKSIIDFTKDGFEK